MKKLTTTLKTFALFALATVMVSCGSKTPTPEEVASKIENGQELSQADYTAMLEYVGDYAEKAQDYYNTINIQPNDSTAEYIKASNDLANLYAKYPYLQTFRTCIANTDGSKFDNRNLELVNKYSNDEGFPLPVGEGTVMENPDVQGMIEQMPATDSTGVIANGVGEAVSDTKSE